MARRRSALGLPPHCDHQIVKGRLYIFVRIGHGPRIRILTPLGSPGFLAEYEDELSKLKAPIGLAVEKGSAREIALLYLRSHAFAELADGVRRKRRKLIEAFVAKNSHRQLDRLEAADVKEMMAKIASPHTRRLWRQALSSLCAWAADQTPPLVRRNPFTEAPPVELPKATPHRRWQPEHVAGYRNAHASGTIERRALEALINTMARGRSDVSRLIRTNIQNGTINFVAAKNDEPLDGIPISPEFQRELDALPATELVLFRGRNGIMTPRQFGDMFKAACVKAGLPDDLTAHGLRHTGACEAAERGENVPTIMALLGDRSPAAAMVYVQQANVIRMRREAHARRAKTET
jgi:integrase